MKPFLSAFALAALLAGPAAAGSLTDPIVADDVAADAAANSSAAGVPLVLFLAAVIFAVASD
ncbi:hypothetical protein RXV86_04910 [Alisedimentitalea sp. MJ-SS2]|uniref:hypothetical protein n=1 Tax=Aliisedimentitalea sp. MJ-SS2 TaxID=3049795 RepID=UPI00290DA378|nr:hypothetical protein [Alisedimentitalea sp. MJ-SS2]MDU8926721.1 hypothetical protein [Alisedimentitalea sp. MJ-SS2]